MKLNNMNKKIYTKIQQQRALVYVGGEVSAALSWSTHNYNNNNGNNSKLGFLYENNSACNV
jgi:hypothetical protein